MAARLVDGPATLLERGVKPPEVVLDSREQHDSDRRDQEHHHQRAVHRSPRKQPVGERSAQQPLRVETVLERAEAVELPFAEGGPVELARQRRVLGRVKASAGLNHRLGELGHQPPEVAAALVKIASDGSVSADGTTLPVEQLPGYLRPKLERNPKKSVILQTAPEARYGAMADVFDELRQAGVSSLVIPTSTELALYGLEELR